ncbi:MAG: hypothetical protein V1755_01385 [Chloroflexota bacterium]
MNRAHSARLELPSGLQVEGRRLSTLLHRYLTCQFSEFFDLSRAGAGRRRLRSLLYVLLFTVAAFGAHLFLQLQFRSFDGSPLDLNALLPVAIVTGLRIVLIVAIAASVGLHVAGRFLADIFELKDARTAWRYIGRLAAGTGDEVLHLREGRLTDADRNSPMVQIGGPGRVFVEDDTAALFEKPDGTPHVVGSADRSGHGAGGRTAGTVLEGFERLREPVINLRDQYIGNPSGEPLTVVGRSLDGMPISVTDVRGVFSIRRDTSPAEPQASVERPFPFRARDVENLIYLQAVPVLTVGEHPSGLPGDWTTAMHVLISESLREFMSQNPLAEYLAGVGAHETERSEFRADTILSRTLQVSSEAPGTGASGLASAPRFRPRTELSSKFKKYGSEFSTRAQELGLELHWIGVGTWKMPDEASEAAVGEKHLEAWRMNRENAQRSDLQALERVAESALLEHKIRLIQDVPLARHKKNQARYTDKGVLMECMLQDFWEQLGDALDLHYRSGARSAELEQLEEAVLKVERLLRISQMGAVLGGGTMSHVREHTKSNVNTDAPPAPASRAEAEKYQLLLSKLQGDYRVAEAMITNERRRHAELSRTQLLARIVERFERHGH